jgi:hypothetical protein
MASNDTRRLNPGIQVADLFPGVASKVDPHLVRETSAPDWITNTMVTHAIIEQGANPTFLFALNSSGSLVELTT